MTSEEKKNTLISCVEMALIYCASLYGLYLYSGKLDAGVFFTAFLCMIVVFYVHLVVRTMIRSKNDGVEFSAEPETDLQSVNEDDDVYSVDDGDNRHYDLDDDFDDDDYCHDDDYYYNDNFEYEDDEYFYYRKKKPRHLRRVDCESACAYFGSGGFGISPPGIGGS